MLSVLILASYETAARVLAAGVRGVVLQSTSSGRLLINFSTDQNGQLTSGGATLYAALVSASYIDPQVPDTTPVYQLSTTTSDGTAMEFLFPSRVGRIVATWIGGVVQLPADATVSVNGGILFGGNVPPPPAGPAGNITALFVKAG